MKITKKKKKTNEQYKISRKLALADREQDPKTGIYIGSQQIEPAIL